MTYADADDEDRPPLATVELTWQGARCRACHKPVIWAITAANNRRICLDARPTADGRVEILRVSFGDPVAKLHSDAPPEGHLRYRVHIASCQPRARGWRGRQQKGTT